MNRRGFLSGLGVTAANSDLMLLRSSVTFKISGLETMVWPPERVAGEIKKGLTTFASSAKTNLGASAPNIIGLPAISVTKQNGSYLTVVTYKMAVPSGTKEAILSNTALGTFVKNFILKSNAQLKDRMQSFSLVSKKDPSAPIKSTTTTMSEQSVATTSTPVVSTPAAKTNGLPLSYTQQWMTLYLLVAGTRPIAAQEALGLLTPWLTGKLKTSQMPVVQSVRVSVVNDPDMGPVIISAPFNEGGRITQAGKLENTIVTGIKWNLRTPNYSAVTDDFLGSLRSGFKSSGRQSLEQLGFKIVLSAMQAYGKSFSGQIVDYNLPETPALPPQPVTPAPSPKPAPLPASSPRPGPTPAPVPISPGTKYSLIHWAIGATALILVALATKKINGKESQQVSELDDVQLPFKIRRLVEAAVAASIFGFTHEATEYRWDPLYNRLTKIAEKAIRDEARHFIGSVGYKNACVEYDSARAHLARVGTLAVDDAILKAMSRAEGKKYWEEERGMNP